MTLEQARIKYRLGELTFMQLEKVFEDKATDKEVDEFWKTNVYDKPNYVIGKSQEQMDKEFNDIIRLG